MTFGHQSWTPLLNVMMTEEQPIDGVGTKSMWASSVAPAHQPMPKN